MANHLKKGADGKFHKYFTFEGKRYHVRGGTEPELYMNYARMLSDLEQGVRRLDKDTTVRQWSEEWLEVYKKGKITQKSYDTYPQKLDGYILPAIGRMKLKDVTDVHLQRLMNEQEGKSFSHCTKVRMVLREMFGQAVQSRILTYDPARKLKLPTYAKGERRSLTAAERSAVLAVAATHRAGLWVKMILYCGLRPGETLALKWKDIDFDAGVIHVHEAKESGSKTIKAPKTDAGIRTVPVVSHFLRELKQARRSPFLNVFTQADQKTVMTEASMRNMWRYFLRLVDIQMAETALKAIAQEKNKERRKHLLRQLESDLPKTQVERRIKEGNLKCTFKNKVVIHGLTEQQREELTPYCLRHTYCTDLQRAGVPLNVAKYLMGHADISTTANIYTHTTDDVIQDAADKMETFTGPESGADLVQFTAPNAPKPAQKATTG